MHEHLLVLLLLLLSSLLLNSPLLLIITTPPARRYFLVYEAVVGYKLRKDNLTRAELPGLWAMLGGAISGPTLWLMVYPVDVIKSRLQTDALDPAKRQYKGTLDCARQIFAQGGFRGFFRGLIPTLARAPISNAATFVTYEWAARHLEGYVRE